MSHVLVLTSSLQSDQLEVARLLIEFKADINLTNRYGLTPLDIAHRLGRESFIPLLSEEERVVASPE